MRSIIISIICLWGSSLQAQNFQWVVRMGMEGVNEVHNVAYLSNGDIISAGFYVGNIDIDPGPGVLMLNNLGGGSRDIFIQRLTPSGQLVWGKQIGGNGDDEVYAMSVDANDNIYIAGVFNYSANLSTDPNNPINFSGMGGGVTFITKLNANGITQWAKLIESNEYRLILGLAVDASSNIIAGGFFSGETFFNPDSETSGVFNASGGYDAFLLKWNTDGEYQWCKVYSNSGASIITAVTVDMASNIIAAGYFEGTLNFNSGGGNGILNGSPYPGDHFILRHSTNGDFSWVKHFTAVESGEIDRLTTDQNLNIYCNYSFFNTINLNPPGNEYEFVPTDEGYDDFVLIKIKPDAAIEWAKHFKGGTGVINALGLAVTNQAICISGYYDGVMDVDPASPEVMISSGSNHDIFIIRLNLNGDLIMAASMGSAQGEERCYDVAFNGSDRLAFGGQFQNTVDFDHTSATFNLTAQSFYDAYVLVWKEELVGITEPMIKDVVPVHPNPANDYLYITNPFSHASQIEITNINGQQVYTGNVSDKITSIDIRSLSSGTYFIRLTGNTQTIISKFVKNE